MPHFTLKLRCPYCLFRIFHLAIVQDALEIEPQYECQGCGYTDISENLYDNTPKGCIAVTMGEDVKE